VKGWPVTPMFVTDPDLEAGSQAAPCKTQPTVLDTPVGWLLHRSAEAVARELIVDSKKTTASMTRKPAQFTRNTASPRLATRHWGTQDVEQPPGLRSRPRQDRKGPKTGCRNADSHDGNAYCSS
jgi:hypothetical protein